MSAARRWIRNDVVFTCVALSLVALSYTPLVGPLNELLCSVSFRGANWLLSALDIQHVANATRRMLSRGSFSLEVSGLCSGLRALALWGAVMLLVPLPRRQKVLHFALGVATLLLVNIVRITHLFQLGVGHPARFSLFHEWIWPTAIVGAVLLYRLVMLLEHRNRPVEVTHA